MSEQLTQDMQQRPEKRHRHAKATTTWEEAAKWITSNGGTVHPSLTFSSTDRSVRTLSDVSAGTTLMRIPSSCLVTANALADTLYSRKLVDALDRVDDQLHNDCNDLLLALYMARCTASSGETSSNNYGAYLSTLPASDSYDAIPRRWNDEKLSSLLGGTSLLQRAKKDRTNLRSDYDAIASSWNAQQNASTNGEISIESLPSYQQFDDMFAAVSSRGFAGLGSDDGKSDAMVPLLGLLDHRRGVGGKKDVRYKRCPSSTTAKGADSTAVEVAADRDLSAGSIIHDTYGAKGNAQLLSRYGFCIEDNIEPDGSSNDVVEFIAKPDHPPVELRAGPKAYTYGGFVRALDLFLEDDSGERPGGDDDDENGAEDDMEAFLNQCDDEEGEAFGMMYGGDMDEGADDADGEDEESTKAECDALEKLSNALEKARLGYALKGEQLQRALDKKDFSPEYCAAILVQSERRTLKLFQVAADKIRRRIQGEGAVIEKADSSDIIQAQVDELVAAYVTIRHDDLL